ncbi:MAG: hypothetical protein EPO01_00390 [Aquabacterium sp.]|nr:MAG: hypothetical protein EPO12_22710 [Aquabacterium sp.]TAL27473.1 MAG: hypothetical protein EPO01_00390 [Aquabacterium sp.]
MDFLADGKDRSPLPDPSMHALAGGAIGVVLALLISIPSRVFDIGLVLAGMGIGRLVAWVKWRRHR